MTADIIKAPAEPDGAARIPVLDILRGLAILAILFMNINDMGASLLASGRDIRHLGWGAADQAVWVFREITANGTARCLLEMLFGAGMVILTDRAAAKAGDRRWAVMRGYYWRNIILFLFGLVHVFILLWPGDILHSYGLAALVAFWFRRLRPRWLILIGLSLATLQLTFGGYSYFESSQRRAQVTALEARQGAGDALTPAEKEVLKQSAIRRAERAQGRDQMKAAVASEDRGRTGTTAMWVREQWVQSIDRIPMEVFAIWEAAAAMLVGAALFKTGILQGQRDRRFYLWLMLAGYGIGGALRTIGALGEIRFDDSPNIIWFTSEYARIAMTLGHIALVNWLVQSAAGIRLMKPFIAAGRTALSIYIAQTIICLWILYPPFALGLYGQHSWWELMLVALAINVGLTWAANLYLRHYRIAPVEWAWRSLVERRRLPFRARTDAAAVPA